MHKTLYSNFFSGRMTDEYGIVNYCEGSGCEQIYLILLVELKKPRNCKSLSPLFSGIRTQFFSNISLEWYCYPSLFGVATLVVVTARQRFSNSSFRFSDNFRPSEGNLLSFLPWRQRQHFTQNVATRWQSARNRNQEILHIYFDCYKNLRSLDDYKNHS
jgi:hypothetical protein